jgi:hypothetical protein
MRWLSDALIGARSWGGEGDAGGGAGGLAMAEELLERLDLARHVLLEPPRGSAALRDLAAPGNEALADAFRKGRGIAASLAAGSSAPSGGGLSAAAARAPTVRALLTALWARVDRTARPLLLREARRGAVAAQDGRSEPSLLEDLEGIALRTLDGRAAVAVAAAEGAAATPSAAEAVSARLQGEDILIELQWPCGPEIRTALAAPPRVARCAPPAAAGRAALPAADALVLAFADGYARTLLRAIAQF